MYGATLLKEKGELRPILLMELCLVYSPTHAAHQRNEYLYMSFVTFEQEMKNENSYSALFQLAPFLAKGTRRRLFFFFRATENSG